MEQKLNASRANRFKWPFYGPQIDIAPPFVQYSWHINYSKQPNSIRPIDIISASADDAWKTRKLDASNRNFSNAVR